MRNQQAEKERTSQTYAQLRAQAAEKERQKANDDFRRGERETGKVAAPQPKSWLQNVWDNTRNFVQEKIVQPFDKYVYQPLIKPVVEKVTQTTQIIWSNTKTFVQEKVTPIIQKALTPSSLLKAAITTTMVATTSVALQCCGGKCGGTPTPDVSALSTQAVQTVMAQFHITQTAMAPTATPVPPTTTSFQFPADKIFTTNKQIFTCNDVALYFGVELNALLTANPDLNCNAVNIGVTQFKIPPLTLKSPSEYVSQYNCVPSAGQICLSPNATAEEMIAYTLFNEGGSSEGSQFSADVMQVMLNHANKILENWGMDRSQMSRDDYAGLVLYVISKPAQTGANVAAFEAFSSPSEPPQPNTDSEKNWNATLQIAQAILDNKGLNWAQSLPRDQQPKTEIKGQDVLFYCSVRTQENPPFGSTARVPEQGTGLNDVVTYFFNGYQYNQSIAQWCKDNR